MAPKNFKTPVRMADLSKHDSDISVVETGSTTSSIVNDPPNVDKILEHTVKPFGPWQFVSLMICCCGDIPAALFPIFGNSVPAKFHCKMEPHIQDLFYANQSRAPIVHPGMFEPKGPIDLTGQKYELPFDKVAAAIGPWGNATKQPGCFRYKRDYVNIKSLEELFKKPEIVETEACPLGYVYESNSDQYPSGIVVEWDLACSKEWLGTLSTSLYMLGMALGFWIGGLVADTIGRRKTANVFWVAQITTGICCSLAPNFVSYALFRFLLGLTCVARANALLILPSEITTAKYRYVVTFSLCIVQGFISRALATLAAFLIPYWRWLHLAIVSPLIIGLFQVWFVPESPRWLISQKRWNEAAKVLHKGYLINSSGFCCFGEKKKNSEKLTLSHFEAYFAGAVESEKRLSNETKAPKKSCVKSLIESVTGPLKTFQLAKISSISAFLFIVQTACLYGVLLYARVVRGNVYLVSFLNNLTGIPGAVLSSVLYARIHRRKLPLMVTYICATVCLAVGGCFAVFGFSTNDIVLTVFSNFSLVLCTAINSMSLTYVPELFPSIIRSQGLGLTAGLGKFGAVVGTFVNRLDITVAHGSPLLVYSGLLLLGCFVLFFSPETTGENLKDNIEDNED